MWNTEKNIGKCGKIWKNADFCENMDKCGKMRKNLENLENCGKM